MLSNPGALKSALHQLTGRLAAGCRAKAKSFQSAFQPGLARVDSRHSTDIRTQPVSISAITEHIV